MSAWERVIQHGMEFHCSSISGTFTGTRWRRSGPPADLRPARICRDARWTRACEPSRAGNEEVLAPGAPCWFRIASPSSGGYTPGSLCQYPERRSAPAEAVMLAGRCWSSPEVAVDDHLGMEQSTLMSLPAS